uniref:E3 ubiquitin protein ligase n=1 Tax=Serinus canaria TaxID=9135 RepID=A0A8C9MUD7_SERCA
RRLQELTLHLHEKHQREALEVPGTHLRLTCVTPECHLCHLCGLQWDSAKLRKREGRLDRHLAEALEQFWGFWVFCAQFEMLNAELEGNQELANSRMAELEKLQLELQAAVRGQERLKVALRSLPEEAVKEALEYKVLQSQFSLLYHESLQVKTQLDEARALLLATKNSHLRHIEHMEVRDELGVQKRLRTEVIQLEDTLAQVRKEYEMLRIEFEQNLAANEQAGPINREMRHLISSLQNHNHQLKGDVQRYKRKLREVQAEINKVGGAKPGWAEGRGHSEYANEMQMAVRKAKGMKFGVDFWGPSRSILGRLGQNKRGGAKQMGVVFSKYANEMQMRWKWKVKENQKEAKFGVSLGFLVKAQENQKEMKLLLDMYKSAPKEQRDKVTLMAAERKSKAELEELRCRWRELEERERRESKKLADEEALRRLRLSEEQIEHLQRRLAATKQVREHLGTPGHTWAPPVPFPAGGHLVPFPAGGHLVSIVTSSHGGHLVPFPIILLPAPPTHGGHLISLGYSLC